MDALARGLIHKRGCLTSETGRLDQSGASIEDAARVRRERGVCVCVNGVISFRKMRHLWCPSHCGSLSLSFLVNNDDHQWTPLPPLSFSHDHARAHFLNKTQGSD